MAGNNPKFLFIPGKADNQAHQPGYGTDMRKIETTVNGLVTGVSQIIAGSNITISPPDGEGAVTINATSTVGGYASLTGPGQSTTPGALTQHGPFTVTDTTGGTTGIHLTTTNGQVALSSLSSSGLSFSAVNGGISLDCLGDILLKTSLKGQGLLIQNIDNTGFENQVGFYIASAAFFLPTPSTVGAAFGFTTDGHIYYWNGIGPWALVI
jgi:hypothetical protein